MPEHEASVFELTIDWNRDDDRRMDNLLDRPDNMKWYTLTTIGVVFAGWLAGRLKSAHPAADHE